MGTPAVFGSLGFQLLEDVIMIDVMSGWHSHRYLNLSYFRDDDQA